MRTYSHFFSSLHDDEGPIGTLGRGTHYSVLRCAEWVEGFDTRPLLTAKVHDFAVIWDEDHDERIIGVLERVYMNGLLSPILFVGERKGTLTLILSTDYIIEDNGETVASYMNRVADFGHGADGDSWDVTFGFIDKAIEPLATTSVGSIIQADERRSEIYLRNIDLLWNLGMK